MLAIKWVVKNPKQWDSGMDSPVESEKGGVVIQKLKAGEAPDKVCSAQSHLMQCVIHQIAPQDGYSKGQ